MLIIVLALLYFFNACSSNLLSFTFMDILIPTLLHNLCPKVMYIYTCVMPLYLSIVMTAILTSLVMTLDTNFWVDIVNTPLYLYYNLYLFSK